MAATLHVRINSPEKIIWEGEAMSVSSKNADGPFDILPLHTNFITFVEKEVIQIKVAEKIEEYTFPMAVIYTHANTVFIYTTI